MSGALRFEPLRQTAQGALGGEATKRRSYTVMDCTISGQTVALWMSCGNFIFWIFMAYRAFERGDVMMAGVFALVGIVLTAYRYSAAQKIAKAKSQSSAS